MTIIIVTKVDIIGNINNSSSNNITTIKKYIYNIVHWIKNADKILKEEIKNIKEEYCKENINNSNNNNKKLIVIEMDENKCIGDVSLLNITNTEVCQRNYLLILKKPKNNKGKLYLDKMVWTIVDRNKGRIIDFKVGNDNIENANLLMYNLLSNNNKIDLTKEGKEKEEKEEKE